MRQDSPSGTPISPSGPLNATARAPASKSLTIRALAAAALARGRSLVREPLVAGDTLVMEKALATLGATLSRHGADIQLEGTAGRILSPGAALDLGDAGTPLRLLTAICCLGRGRFVLDGSPRMRQRPIGDLVEALGSLGARARCVNEDGCPPVRIEADGLAGGRARLSGLVSSQYISALLMAAPCAAGDLRIEIEGDLVSRPYVDLTVQVMERFGARVEHDEHRWFLVRSDAPYRAAEIAIEGDASSASYLFAAAAITGGRVTVTGIPPDSRQGDLRLLDLLAAMGCRVERSATGLTVEGAVLRGIEADLRDIPDVAPTLASVALFAEGATRITDVAHLRLKETDRIEGIAACVRALGGQAEIGPDHLIVRPPSGGRSGLSGAAIDPRGDHRLAMAFAVTGLAVPGVRVLDPGCVSKSDPDFFQRLESLRA